MWYQRVEELPAEEPVQSFWPMVPRHSILGDYLTTENDSHLRLSTKRKFEQSYVEENISLFKRVRIINHGSDHASWKILRNAVAAGELNLKQNLQLIDLGVNINSPAEDPNGFTALHVAAIVAHTGIAYRLIRNGADVNAPESGDKRRTALEVAAEYDRLDMVQILIHAGADNHLPTNQRYRKAARLANDNHHYAVANILALNFST